MILFFYINSSVCCTQKNENSSVWDTTKPQSQNIFFFSSVLWFSNISIHVVSVIFSIAKKKCL